LTRQVEGLEKPILLVPVEEDEVGDEDEVDAGTEVTQEELQQEQPPQEQVTEEQKEKEPETTERPPSPERSRPWIRPTGKSSLFFIRLIFIFIYYLPDARFIFLISLF